MKHIEIRVALPFTLAQYEIGCRYTTNKMMLLETGGNCGWEKVHGFEHGNDSELGNMQFERCILYVNNQLPNLLRTLLPTGSDEIEIQRLSNFPKAKILYTNPAYMKDNFHITTNEVSEPGKSINENALQRNSADFV